MLSAAALLVVSVFACYANSLSAPFVYDDIPAIRDNPTIRHLWPLTDALWPQAEGGLTVSGRPALNLSLALNHALSGDAVWSYHALNVLIHAGAALLLFGVVRRTISLRNAQFSAPEHRPGAAASASTAPLPAFPLALGIAALWALHPLQTQAVTYTVQRAESLMGLFYLLTLYAFTRGAVGSPARVGSGRRWLAGSVAACALGMGTKEVMATAPLLVLLYDRTFVTGSFRAAWRERRGYYLGLAGTWVLLGALVLSTGGNRGGTVGLGVGVPLWAYPLTQFKAVATYLGLAVWPQPLVFEYGTFWVERAGDILPFAAVIVPLLAGTVFALWKKPPLGFAGAWFFGILAPTSLAPGTIQMIVEHRPYLPLAAVIALLVIALHRVLGRLAWPACAVAALASGALTALRNHDYRSHLALWSKTVAQRPENPRAHEGLAEAYAELGRLDEAIAQHAEAARLLPDESHYQYNLARALGEAGRWDAAVVHYRHALRLAPAEAKTHNNLAIALSRAGQGEAALAHYAEAERLVPTEPQYPYNHGIALARLGRFPEAIARYEAVLRLRPTHADALYGLGNALAASGRPAEAIARYKAALQAEPDHANAHFKLGNALIDADRVPDAMIHYEAAVRFNPTDAEAHHNLGIAYARLERLAEAGREFEAALRLRPDYGDAQRHLAQVRELLRR
ncbi:MAG: tetratricopeptide repeat protein [Verrucomicrobia bacterium]|nr:tetratricopeptide repeat protein [Verrucomicrobiota bacterium]